MEDLNSINRRQHKMTVTNRKGGSLTGVKDVIAFDEGEVILETDMGVLMIKGNGLHVKRLNLENGEVDLEGRMDSFFYSEAKGSQSRSESFLTRLFK